MTFDLHLLVARYGYLAVFILILAESAGIPIPGEAVLIAAALFAGHTHHLDIFAVIAVAAFATALGGSGGYLLGHFVGNRLLDRYGRYVGLTPARRRLGNFLFLRHGGKIVFFGRFIAVLRTFAGVLAGANDMPMRRFFVANSVGALIWAGAVGGGAYAFGRAFAHVARPVSLAILGVTVMIVLGGLLVLRGQERRLQNLADRALQGEA